MKNVRDAGFSRKRGGNAGSGPPLPDPVFNEHFTGLAERLADKTVMKAIVDEPKVSDSKLAFPPITPSQTHQLIKAIPSCKATGLDLQ